MYRLVLTAILTVACSTFLAADVRTETKTQMRLEGMLGRMLNMFGGRAAREGSVSIVAVKGDRKATRTDQTGQIVDLAEEKIYDIDYEHRRYKVTTFAEVRQQMADARRRAAEQSPGNGSPREQPSPDAGSARPEVEVDFNLTETGQKRAINGFDAREVVMTIEVREKGTTLEQNGGFVLTTNLWLAPEIETLNEVAAFDLRYAQKLNALAMFDAQQMAAISAMYPMMSDAMQRFEAENVNMDGTAVMTVSRFEAVASTAQAAEQQQEQQAADERPRSLGGLGGALAGRLGRRALGGNKDEASTSATPGRTTVMTMTHEVLSVAPSVADADVTIPAGFREK